MVMKKKWISAIKTNAKICTATRRKNDNCCLFSACQDWANFRLLGGLASFFVNYRNSPNLWSYLFYGKSYVISYTKTGWAMYMLFAKTNLVALSLFDIKLCDCSPFQVTNARLRSDFVPNPFFDKMFELDWNKISFDTKRTDHLCFSFVDFVTYIMPNWNNFNVWNWMFLPNYLCTQKLPTHQFSQYTVSRKYISW
jgi:hypothetical protein